MRLTSVTDSVSVKELLLGPKEGMQSYLVTTTFIQIGISEKKLREL